MTAAETICQLAYQESLRLGRQRPEPEDLLLALVKFPYSPVKAFLEARGVTLQSVRDLAGDECQQLAPAAPPNVELLLEAKGRAIAAALGQAASEPASVEFLPPADPKPLPRGGWF